jgi:hypothetical protein
MVAEEEGVMIEAVAVVDEEVDMMEVVAVVDEEVDMMEVVAVVDEEVDSMGVAAEEVALRGVSAAAVEVVVEVVLMHRESSGKPAPIH